MCEGTCNSKDSQLTFTNLSPTLSNVRASTHLQLVPGLDRAFPDLDPLGPSLRAKQALEFKKIGMYAAGVEGHVGGESA